MNGSDRQLSHCGIQNDGGEKSIISAAGVKEFNLNRINTAQNEHTGLQGILVKTQFQTPSHSGPSIKMSPHILNGSK